MNALPRRLAFAVGHGLAEMYGNRPAPWTPQKVLCNQVEEVLGYLLVSRLHQDVDEAQGLRSSSAQDLSSHNLAR